jgi:HlyD family secretion protein
VDVYGEAIADAPVTGKVLRIYPAGFTKISSLGVEQQRVNVAIKLDRRPERLGVGFRVYVRIYHASAPDALTLPRTALFRGEDGLWQVMVVRDGVTQLAPLKLGLLNEESAQVLEGVTEADAVIARPAQDIVPGLRVVPRGLD